jgi:hypothetical protein
LVHIVPATAELLERFYGSAPTRSQRAVVAIKDDRVIGVAGIYTEDESSVMFSDLTDELRKDKRTVVRGIREVMKLAARRALPVYALADPEVDGSERLLLHMGFEHYRDGIYRWQT